jgi:choline dehydrogenase-like flavoprotein
LTQLTHINTASASKEVILCAGAIDTPKVLLLNGIGPRAELEALGVEVKKDLPGVGKHLQDHVLAFMSAEVDGSINERYTFESNTELVAEAQEAWNKDQSGAFALHQSVVWGGFLKLPHLKDMPEYQQLPPDSQKFLSRETIPAYEFISNGPLWPPGVSITPGNSYLTICAFLMHPQSEGSVTLRSKDAAEKPIIKLNYLTHPYDRAVFREAIRATWNKLMLNPVIAPSIHKTLCGPASLSDEDIEAFAADQASTVWHANGTVKMGKQDDQGACVDENGKVFGFQGLRVADLSVCPLTTSNHTQATAYLVGQKMSEKMIREYGLDGKA